MSKCEGCASQFSCQSENEDCNEVKEKYVPLELDEPEFCFVDSEHWSLSFN